MVLSEGSELLRSAIALAELNVKPGKRRYAVRSRMAAELGSNIRRLTSAYRAAYKRAGGTGGGGTAADELLVNDFYRIEKHFSPAVDAVYELNGVAYPVFASGEKTNSMRIYALIETFCRENKHIYPDELRAFIEEYADRSPLTSAEVRLIPDMLRLALIARAAREIRADGSAALEQIHSLLEALSELADGEFTEAAEKLDPADRLLMSDEGYHSSDKESRLCYIVAAEKIARSTGAAETAVVRTALELAGSGEGIASGVGYYLLAEGRSMLLAAIRPDKYGKNRAAKTERHGLRLAGFIITKLILTLSLCTAAGFADGSAFSALLLLLPVSAAVSALLMRVSARFFEPRPLPRLALSSDVGEENRTLVCVSELITDEKMLDAAIETIERHCLAAGARNVEFCILGDFPDSDTAECEGEAELIEQAKRRIDALNTRYNCGDRPVFHFLHRKRSYSPADKRYRGRERKRGAIEALISYLTGGDGSEFILNEPVLSRNFRFLTVLDADTVMPGGALLRLIGAAAHPLNMPKYKDGETRPYRGFNIIVPRMAATSRSAAASRFAGLVSGESGLTAYSVRVSDFFFDLFSEANFGGKGIINIEGFKRAVQGKIPENTVLSHDILEGGLSGAGLSSSTVLYDTEPASFFAWHKRRHRWLRGDVQLLPFILGEKGKTLSCVTKYKLFSNITTGFLNIAALAALLTGVYFNLSALTAAALIAYFFDPLLSLLSMLFSRERCAVRPLVLLVRRRLLELAALVFSAVQDADAIIRSLWRMFVSHKRMLEWQTADSAAKNGRNYVRLWSCSAVGASMAALGAVRLALGNSGFADCAGIAVGLLFLLAPAIIIHADGRRREYRMPEEERAFLMEAARRTWQYFEENCCERTHFLPPDNVQIEPARGAAEITSPTNIGMGILAAAAAHELGFIDADGFILRLDRTISTVEKLEKWRGNPYNWYSTADLSLLLPRFVSSVDCGNLFVCLVTAAEAVREAGRSIQNGAERAEKLAARMDALAEGMDLAALYDEKKKLFRVGLEFDEGRFTSSCYDLWASEARLTSFAAIAFSKVESRHWAALSRLECDARGGRTLKSWSGTAFEYLMPFIFFDTVEGSMQHEITKSAVLTQVLESGGRRPWGESESGYYSFDNALRYQYRAFGSAELALSKQRKRETVVAPYAAFLALAVEPRLAVENLRCLEKAGLLGKYGFYEALDLDAERTGGGAAVRSFMAHHQGMSLCAAANALTDGKLKSCFMRLPRVAANEQLLFENMPVNPIKISRYKGEVYRPPLARRGEKSIRIFSDADENRAGILSNGAYSVVMTADGRGVSACTGRRLTRYRRESGAESGIEFIVAAGKTVKRVVGETVFEPHRITVNCRVSAVKARLGTTLLPDHKLEKRTLTLINCGRERIRCSVGVFAEISLATVREDEAHPAFVRVSVDSKAEGNTALFTRRRKPGETGAVGFFRVRADGEVFLCTDGLTSPGRGRDTLRMARDFHRTKAGAHERYRTMPKEMSTEPYFSALTAIELEPGASTEVILYAGIAKDAESAADALIEGERLRYGTERARAAERLTSFGIHSREAEIVSRLSYNILTGTPAKRGGRNNFAPNEAEVNGKELHGKSALWRFGVSGDLPILLMPVKRAEHVAAAELVARCSRFMLACGLEHELVFIGEYPNEYGEPLRSALTSSLAGFECKLLHGFETSERERRFLISCALEVIDPDDIEDGLAGAEKTRLVLRKKPESAAKQIKTLPASSHDELTFFNGYGGFDIKRGEYRMFLSGERRTPLPWSNAVAGGKLGFLITERGGGYTFLGNARLRRITPWSNDPLGDRCGERLTLIDADTGERLNLSGGDGEYEAAHGFGYTRFVFRTEEFTAELTETADAVLPVKYYCIEVNNSSNRSLSLTAKLEADLVLGENIRSEALSLEATEDGIRAHNALFEGEEEGFLAIASGARLTGADADRAAIYGRFEVKKGKSARAIFLLGCEKPQKIEKTIQNADFDKAMEANCRFRAEKLDALFVRTGRAEFDTLVNGRLIYQLYSSRLFTKTGFYQSGGATGFRDQLQDVAALLMTDPACARRQIIEAASKQFPKGDVLHWWHPDGRGVRTHISDDRLFLPIAACEYADATGELAVFDETVPFLEDCPIPDESGDLYTVFREEGSGSLMEHCRLAIDLSMNGTGKHGLPLMQGGDWNDGMDRVGRDGGESTVVGFLAVIAARKLARICKKRGDDMLAGSLEEKAGELLSSIERSAWNGRIYERAFFGDETPLSVTDCVSACFAVFAGAKHAREGFEATLRELVDSENGLIKLLSPPFTAREGKKDVGYIEGYIPGVRENGGQYTHAAAWCVIAACRLGMAETAERLFRMLNPIVHGSAEGIERYKTEPYAVCGDVYSVGRLAGRGGWSLYTGAAGWLSRAATEHILGIKKRGSRLFVEPCTTLNEFEFEYRFGKTLYRIRAVRGKNRQEDSIALADDGKTHDITVEFE